MELNMLTTLTVEVLDVWAAEINRWVNKMSNMVK